VRRFRRNACAFWASCSKDKLTVLPDTTQPTPLPPTAPVPLKTGDTERLGQFYGIRGASYLPPFCIDRKQAIKISFRSVGGFFGGEVL
jgi:hypothetical protein